MSNPIPTFIPPPEPTRRQVRGRLGRAEKELAEAVLQHVVGPHAGTLNNDEVVASFAASLGRYLCNVAAEVAERKGDLFAPDLAPIPHPAPSSDMSHHRAISPVSMNDSDILTESEYDTVTDISSFDVCVGSGVTLSPANPIAELPQVTLSQDATVFSLDRSDYHIGTHAIFPISPFPNRLVVIHPEDNLNRPWYVVTQGLKVGLFNSSDSFMFYVHSVQKSHFMKFDTRIKAQKSWSWFLRFGMVQILPLHFKNLNLNRGIVAASGN